MKTLVASCVLCIVVALSGCAASDGTPPGTGSTPPTAPPPADPGAPPPPTPGDPTTPPSNPGDPVPPPGDPGDPGDPVPPPGDPGDPGDPVPPPGDPGDPGDPPVDPPVDPPTTPGAVGAPCASDADCGAGGTCIPSASDGTDTGFVDGYCVMVGCSDTTPCPDGSACFILGSEMTPVCIATCETDATCRGGYVCDADSTCWPGCSASRPCPGGLACGGDGVCATPGGSTGTGECSPSNPTGACAGSLLCIDGACSEPPACDADPFEPNDSRATATPLVIGRSATGGRCAGDSDWYRIDVPVGSLVHVLVTTPDPFTAGNIDAYAYREDGSLLGGRFDGYDPMPSWVRANETREEGFGFYAGSTPLTYYVRVTGDRTSATGAYTVLATSTEWVDGATCTGAGFTSSECTGGSRDAQTLWMFPYPDPSDPYNGDGYVFDSLTNYRYLRRETMMLVRHAMREVALEFPGTHPLGLIDMCQRDAITPGYDVDDPRHPESTHDQGGNIDIAYYQTGPDNHARVICDAAEGSVTADYFCASSAASTHTVDLPRTVYFIAALTRSPRVRVIGVDRVIGPLLEAEAARMRDAGTITSAEHDAVVNSLAYGSGWPFHHHHLHLSLEWL
ncbi:MAG: hypothetical protein IT379_24415 [Deltaproteobacteria bacterium]|nr:hypothetical protein [Deltaproteobacteria bacterium]